MRLLFLLVVLFSFSFVFPQGLTLTGVVKDSVTGDKLKGASVTVLRLRDSGKSGDITDAGGKFTVENLRGGMHSITITFIGYREYKSEIELRGKSSDMGTVWLVPGDVRLGEIEVVDKAPLVIQKSDTTEFSATAFKVTKDASAEELITKMPGITVKEGKVQAHGEDVKKVLVDGKSFFGDDPYAVLRTIPAEIIERIQVFDQQSEQARFTGFDDGNTNKTVNIVTRNRIREGTFGKLAGGYGTLDKYMTGGNVNVFRGDRRVSVLSQLNNINEQNFSSEDLLGVMSGGGGGRGGFNRPPGMGGFGGGRPPGGGGRDRHNDVGNFLVDAKNGLTKTKAFGLNYIDKYGDIFEMSGSYFFNNTNSDAISMTNRDYFLTPPESQNYTESNASATKNTNHRVNFRMEYKLDTLNSFVFSPRATFQRNEGASIVFGRTFSEASDLNSIKNNFSSNLEAVDASAELVYQKRFETRGRTISLRLNGALRPKDGDNELMSENKYYGTTTTADTVNQRAAMNKRGYSGSTGVVYTEPISDNSQLQLSSSFSFSRDNSDQKTYAVNNALAAFTALDTALSNVYEKKYLTQNYGAGFRYQKDEFNMMASVGYNIARLQNDQTFPLPAGADRRFASFLPTFNIRWDISRDKNLRFFYRTSNNDPSVEQLQRVLDNSNPVQLSIGNPNLQQDYRHNIMFRYSDISFETMRSAFFILSATMTQNHIGNRTIIAQRDTIIYDGVTIAPGAQLKVPENFDGYFNLRSFTAYTMPLGLVKTNLNVNLNLSYSRTPGMINSVQNYARQQDYGLGLVFASNISENFDFTISTNGNYVKVLNSARKSSDREYYTQRSRGKCTVTFWEGIVFVTDFEYRYDGNLSRSKDPNSYAWNASLGKKLFSNERGEIRLSAYDLLNRTTNIQRTNTDSYTEQVQNNVIGRFYLLSFIYTLKAF